MLVLFTDGATESADLSGAEFGEDGLKAAVQSHLALDAAGLRDRIFAEVDRFRGSGPQEDDLTVVVAKVR